MFSLHYTTVSLGTPAKKFLVALDTGSDLFWVPCDCSNCASPAGSDYESVGSFSSFDIFMWEYSFSIEVCMSL